VQPHQERVVRRSLEHVLLSLHPVNVLNNRSKTSASADHDASGYRYSISYLAI
jgi:hypothetical protein